MGSCPLPLICCLLALVLTPVPCSGQEFLLYRPEPAAGDHLPASPEQGVLVKKITVERGDTLAKLSRKYTGVARWFPQVLLFNTIKNPDLIYTGDLLLVPVGTGQAALKQRGAKDENGQTPRRTSRRGKSAAEPLIHVTPVVDPGERASYQRAQQAYLDRDYQKALDYFSGFLTKFPHSEFAADAFLYRADCFLQLSHE